MNKDFIKYIVESKESIVHHYGKFYFKVKVKEYSEYIYYAIYTPNKSNDFSNLELENIIEYNNRLKSLEYYSLSRVNEYIKDTMFTDYKNAVDIIKNNSEDTFNPFLKTLNYKQDIPKDIIVSKIIERKLQDNKFIIKDDIQLFKLSEVPFKEEHNFNLIDCITYLSDRKHFTHKVLNREIYYPNLLIENLSYQLALERHYYKYSEEILNRKDVSRIIKIIEVLGSKYLYTINILLKDGTLFNCITKTFITCLKDNVIPKCVINPIYDSNISKVIYVTDIDKILSIDNKIIIDFNEV